MIVGGKIEHVEATKKSENKIDGLSINIALEDIKVKGEEIEVHYTYIANYDKDIGGITIKGVIYTKEDKKLAKEIGDNWKKDGQKKLPPEYASSLLSAINYTGSANGTLVARVLNLSPPLVPPKLQVGN